VDILDHSLERFTVRVLLEGRPGVGKTTVARSLARLLERGRIPVTGFFTEEMRESGRRVGFRVQALGGERGILAHVRIAGPPKVGRYGVGLEAFERIAIPALATSGEAVTVIDELGKMELASERFREAVSRLFDGPAAVVATVHTHRDPFTDALKRRPEVEILRVTAASRDRLPARLAERLGVR
jgi:nucleoside-triphosphatase